MLQVRRGLNDRQLRGLCALLHAGPVTRRIALVPQALKRDLQPAAREARTALLGTVSDQSGAVLASSSAGRETDATAERSNQGLLQLQQQVRRRGGGGEAAAHMEGTSRELAAQADWLRAGHVQTQNSYCSPEQVMAQQDQDLASLERTVVGTKVGRASAFGASKGWRL